MAVDLDGEGAWFDESVIKLKVTQSIDLYSRINYEDATPWGIQI